MREQQNKPRIYAVITTFFPYVGGAETQTLAQCQHLLEHGHEVRIVTFRHDSSWPQQERMKGVPVTRVAGILLGRREHLPRLVQRLLYLIAMLVMSWTLWHHRKHFDVLQVCQFSLLVLPLAMVCRFTGKPMTIVVISAGAGKATKSHDAATLLVGPLDPTLPWLQVDGQTWIDGDLYGLQSAGKAVLRFTRRLLQHIGAVIIVLSNRMNLYLKEHDFDLPGTALIPNGVDIHRFHPASPEAFSKDQALNVICVSKLRYEKGIDVLLHAWRIVHEQLPAVHLIVIGDGPLQIQLEQLADALTISDSIEFAGLQSDVPAHLHRAMIGILPSRWEGMPNALLEAMASGLACIATRVSGSEDLIQHGSNGLLVESEDYQAMAQALFTLLHNPVLAQEYGAAARATVEQHYALEHIMDRYVEVYQGLMAHREHLPKDAALCRTALQPERGIETMES